MRRILLIGKSGQVGRELQTALLPLGELFSVGREEVDLTQPQAIRQVIRETQPLLIVNAAAYTAVDKAETEVALANAINGDAPTVMAEAAQQLGATLIHISTDYVFDGRTHTPYTEVDAPNPIGAYGYSKWLGEQGISQAHASDPAFRYAILRTAWVYGVHGKGNFVKTMLRLGAERDEIRVVADQVGTPTWSAEIARTIAKLASGFLDPVGTLEPAAAHPLSGIYHLTNSGVASWYDFAVAIFEEAKLLGFPLKFQQVVPITTPEYPTPAQRPAYSVLACQKISTVLNAPLPHWRQGLRLMLTDLYQQTHESNYSLRR